MLEGSNKAVELRLLSAHYGLNMTLSAFPAQTIDLLTPADLQASGMDKWTRYPGCIGAFIAEMDYGCPEPVRSALRDTVTSGSLGYLSVEHVGDLARSTAGFLERSFGWAVPTEWVRPLADIVQAFDVFLQHFVGAGGTIIVPTPAYMPFISVPELVGVGVVEIPMLRHGTEWQLDLPAIEAAFAAGASALVLCHPHNPIGKVYSARELQQVCDVVERAGAIVFSDEIHAPIMLAEEAKHVPYASVSPAAAAHSMTAISASKAFNIPGTKCCQVVLTSPEHREIWQRVGRWYEHQTSTLGVYASLAAYDHGAEWLEGALDYLRENIRLCIETLEERAPTVRILPPQASYLLWIDVRETALWATRGSDDVASEIRERCGVAVTDGRECGDVGLGHIRFNAAMPRPVLRVAIQDLAHALTSRENELPLTR